MSAGEAEGPAALEAALERYFGFSSLRPMQREAIEAAIAGRDTLVVLPTGGGKSLCYQLPPLVTGKLTVVVSPLIALMQDQVDGLRLLGYPAVAVHSNLDPDERRQMRAMIESGELRLLLVAPERLFSGHFLELIDQLEIGAIAIDEAHCISQWGHDFRPEYRRLAELRDRFPGVPFHAYTATATPRVRADIKAQLRLGDGSSELVGGFDRPNLTYRVLPRVDLVQQVAEAIARHPDAAAIVYCISRKDTEGLASDLKRRGVDAAAYHAGMGASERTRISADFRAERLSVVVATVAFGMGIDRGDVRLVVHAAMPKSIEHYQQETGRAGRDGLPAECLLLYTAADGAKWRMIIERGAAESGAPDAGAPQLALLQHMQRFAGSANCRHASLSEYFGQALEHEGDEGCGACDVCLKELEPVRDAHVVAQKILSAVARTGQRFGARYVIDVLRGSRGQKVLERGHDRLPTFGLLKEFSASRLGNFIDQLVDSGDLARNDGEYPVLFLNDRSVEVLRGERQAVLMAPKVDLEARPRRSRSRAGAGGARGGRSSPQDIELSPAEYELFEALRVLRRQIAAELSLPPYVVFSDVTLEELAQVRPSVPQRLLGVKGVGQKKLEQFGERFLAAIAEHAAAHGLELDARPGAEAAATQRVIAEIPSAAQRPETSVARRRADALFRQGASIDDVASDLGRAASTVQQYLAEFLRNDPPASIAAWVPDEVRSRIEAALGAERSGRLKPVYDALGGEVSYDTLRLVAAWTQGRAQELGG